MPEPMGNLPLTPDALAQFRGEIDQARALRTKVAKWWDANLKAYAPSVDGDPEKYGGDLNTNRDFTLVERKKPDLFYQQPDVTAVPSPLFAGQEALLKTHTDILNEKLGRDGVDAKALVHDVLFDVLCPAGTGWTKIGYEAFTTPVQTVDPLTGLPRTVEAPIYTSCFWRHVSPRQALVPASFRSTRWDDAPWLGWEFEMPLRVAKRKGWVPEDFQGTEPDQATHFDHKLSTSGPEAIVHGVELIYKSAIYRDDVIHPQRMTLLILIEGVDKPAEHRDHPDQTVDERGQLTPDSLIGFPLHPLTIRTLTDSPVVPSDCTMSRPLVNELNTFRSQMVQFRDATILRWMYNTDTLPPDALAKIVRSPVGGMIGVPSEAFNGEGAIKELPQGSIPRENFTVNDYLDNDLARTHGMDSEQQGASSANGEQTATEAQLQQSNVNARLGFERGIVLDWYIRGVTKFSTLIQRYLSVEDAAKIVGPQAAQMWDSWRKAVPAALAFTALPDSALRNDVAAERKRVLDEYTFFANDPYCVRGELLQKVVAPKLNYPPSVFTNQPPASQPEPTKPGFSFKGEDLNPLLPQFPIVLEILKQCGVTISPEAIAQAQMGAVNQAMMGTANTMEAGQQEGETPTNDQHGGKVPQMESLSKHANDLTGGMQGTGMEAPMGAGGMVQ